MKLDENASCSFMISHHNSPPSDILCKQDCIRFSNSVTRLKSSNVYKSCPKMISLEKRLILTPLQKLLKNVRDLGKLSVATAQTVWPISHTNQCDHNWRFFTFWSKNSSPWQFFQWLLRIWQNFEPTLANFYAIGKIFNVANGQIIQKSGGNVIKNSEQSN